MKMPTYILLGQFTQDGIKDIKGNPERLENSKKLAKSLGGEMTAFYYTLGRYDWVSIVEGVDLDSALKGLLMTGMGGMVRTETLVAYPAEKGAKIIKGIPE
jgi:uncharacterized protein with GYD domain